MNKTNYLILTIILCFSITFVVYPLRLVFADEFSDWAEAYIEAGEEVNHDVTDPNFNPPDSPSESSSSGGNSDSGNNTIDASSIVDTSDLQNAFSQFQAGDTETEHSNIYTDTEVIPDDVEIDWGEPSSGVYPVEGPLYLGTVVGQEEEEDNVPPPQEEEEEEEEEIPVIQPDPDEEETPEEPPEEEDEEPISPLPVLPQYSCSQCRGTTCSVRYSSTPCTDTCRTDNDCIVGIPPSQQVCRCVSIRSYSPCANTCGGGNGGGGGGGGGTPPPPPKYSCNRSSWTCYQNSGGPYSSLSSCQSACVEPPCMIDYFEFPKKAWVGYSITGKWSASTWCEDCDITCTPYPECVWKQDSIGIGSDEHEFTLEESGDYVYTLTCYKQGGKDEKQATVRLEALNLPWWREIVPVLRGFLGGAWNK